MIITDHKGVEHDGFVKLLEQPWDNMAMWISGGADSAFGYWYLAKMIVEHGLDKQLTPIYVDVIGDKYGKKAFTYVDNFVREQWPTANINDVEMFEHWTTPEFSKADRIKEIRMQIGGNYDKLISFITTIDDDFNPSIHESSMDVFERRSPSKMNSKGISAPIFSMCKKGLAEQYRKYDLMDTLYPFTKSCTATTRLPCKKCFWCHEKKWAFGTYDKGVL